MSVIKEHKTWAHTKMSDAVEALDQYFAELEADEDFGPVFDGSTMQADLDNACERLSEAMAYFRSAHERSHWGM